MNDQTNTANLNDSTFGEVIHSYTRAQALADGYLVDITEIATEAGFKIPVAITRAAWDDCIAWGDEDSKRQVHQDQEGRLWDVIYMAFDAARRSGGKSELQYQFYRVPHGGRGIKARLTALKMMIGPGDSGEPVVTILLPNED